MECLAALHLLETAEKNLADKFPEGDGKSLVFCIGVASGTGRLLFGRIADNQRVNRVLLQQVVLSLQQESVFHSQIIACMVQMYGHIKP
ncbi:hypothetical protein J6590_008323 [Homalodisca vitripennis]|nr:hypothetical protein J6590_008323 [Homalodisca vitripennis]